MSSVIDMRLLRLLNISTGPTVISNRVKNERIYWAQFVDRCSHPIKTQERFEDYLHASRAEQDRIKDVGYFVGGHYAGAIRKAANLGDKDVGTLDFDHAPPNYLEAIQKAYGSFEYILYSTHKHHADKPRFRLAFPFSAPVGDQKYAPIMRQMAALYDIDAADDTTYQASRVMHFPSCSCDVEPVFLHNEGRCIDVEAVLNWYNDWTDINEWPVSKRIVKASLRQAGKKASDPREKKGVIGAFCNSHDIFDVMEKFIPNVYAPGVGANRYTFIGGTTANGAVVYDDGQYLYSHHESDPCSGKLVNAFDAVRLHLFGHLDSEEKFESPIISRPSFREMVKFARADPQVHDYLLAERLNIRAEFDEFDANGLDVAPSPKSDTELAIAAVPRPSVTDLMRRWKLKVKDDGIVNTSLANVVSILENDPRLAGCIGLNLFTSDTVQLRMLPGLESKGLAEGALWEDICTLTLKNYFEMAFSVTFATTLINEACDIVARKHVFDSVREWMDTLVWDGVNRLDRFLHDYLGAEDHPYNSAIFRKWLCAGVARTYEPGTKFDYMLVLENPEGKGKSRLFAALSNGWFTDDFNFRLSSKEVVEQASGALIVEIPEVTGHRTAEVEHVKAFISRRTERARMSYGRRARNYPRRWIAGGTTNEATYLKSETGNRRFWCVRGDGRQIDVDAVRALVPQLWAEAKVLYQDLCEPLYLDDGAVLAYAVEQQAERVEVDEWSSKIEPWLSLPIRADHWKRKPGRLDDFDDTSIERVERDRTCVMEVWCECFNEEASRCDLRVARRIGNILRKLGWVATRGMRFGERYGPTCGFYWPVSTAREC